MSTPQFRGMSRQNSGLSSTSTKLEQELSDHVKKCVTDEETAPKAKHVRFCIVYSWDHKTTESFWSTIKLQKGVMGNHIQCYKALITIHKVLTHGHPQALVDAKHHIGFFSAVRASFASISPLIEKYCAFLVAKIRFHERHRDGYTGCFDVAHWQSVHGGNSTDDGYLVMTELFDLAESLNTFAKAVFGNLRYNTGRSTECRVAGLVPCVEESEGMYALVKSMMERMHNLLDDEEVLAPMLTRFHSMFRHLKSFYTECTTIKFITQMVSVPSLPQEPPNFNRSFTKPETNRPASPPPATSDDRALVPVKKDPPTADLLWAEDVQEPVSGNVELEAEIANLRQAMEVARQTMLGFQMRIHNMEQDANARQHAFQQMQQGAETRYRELEAQIHHWKSKYEGMAKMYQSLRTEHLLYLTRLKHLQKEQAAAKDALSEKERYTSMLKSRQAELTRAMAENTKLQRDMDHIKERHQDNLTRLRKDLADQKVKVAQLAKGQGSEMEALLATAEKEKTALESELERKEKELAALQELLESERADATVKFKAKEEEIAVLQSGLDQSLSAYGESMETCQKTEQELRDQLNAATIQSNAALVGLLEESIKQCLLRVNSSRNAFSAKSNDTDASMLVAPSVPQALMSQTAVSAQAFTDAMLLYVSTYEADEPSDECRMSRQKSQTDAMHHGTELTVYLDQASRHLRHILPNTRYYREEQQENHETAQDSMKTAMQDVMNSIVTVFTMSMSACSPDAPNHDATRIREGQSTLQTHMNAFLALTNTYLTDDVMPASTDASGAVDAVEDEMQKAAQAIQDAANRLESMMSPPDDETDAGDVDANVPPLNTKVHVGLLDGARSMTGAIAHLIHCSTLVQKEVVRAGLAGTKGSASNRKAFYKQHSRWTQGLVSAAKMVALATVTLVEAADDVVHGRETRLEPMIVASNEVAAATAQLVAASRVKTLPQDKADLQTNLEAAAKAVTDASKSLVRIAKSFAEKEEKHAAASTAAYYQQLSMHEFKVCEMNQQVEILTLEKELANARSRLATMRKVSYHRDSERVE